MAEAGVTVDPYRSYNFKCECQGNPLSHHPHLLPRCYQDRTNQPHLTSATLDPKPINGIPCTRLVI
jgi:hypothetical protein